MHITIVTPILNRSAFIEQSFRSIIEQRGDFSLEYWVIDGGSDDGTLGILGQYHNKLHYISESDRGQAHALNKGMAVASSDIIGWLNSDDIYLPGTLDKVARCFRQNPGCQWLIGKCRIIDHEGREIRRLVSWYKNSRLTRYSYKNLLHENFISQPAVFFRRSFFRDVGHFDESLHYAMDYDLWLRMGAISNPVILHEYIAAFRWHPLSKTSAQLRNSLQEAAVVAHRYASDRPATLARAWLYRLGVRLAYALLDTVRR